MDAILSFMDGILTFVTSLPWNDAEPTGLLLLGLYLGVLWISVPFLVSPARRGTWLPLCGVLILILGFVYLVDASELVAASQDMWLMVFGGNVAGQSKGLGLVQLFIILPLLALALELEVMTALAFCRGKFTKQPTKQRQPKGAEKNEVASRSAEDGPNLKNLTAAPTAWAVKNVKKADQEHDEELRRETELGASVSTSAVAGVKSKAPRTRTPAGGGRRK
jgi:hypothetical protein